MVGSVFDGSVFDLGLDILSSSDATVNS